MNCQGVSANPQLLPCQVPVLRGCLHTLVNAMCHGSEIAGVRFFPTWKPEYSLRALAGQPSCDRQKSPDWRR
jgi:hypothetical protein